MTAEQVDPHLIARLNIREGDVDCGDNFGLTPAGFLYCARCGCLIMEGLRRVHRQVRCGDR